MGDLNEIVQDIACIDLQSTFYNWLGRCHQHFWLPLTTLSFQHQNPWTFLVIYTSDNCCQLTCTINTYYYLQCVCYKSITLFKWCFLCLRCIVVKKTKGSGYTGRNNLYKMFVPLLGAFSCKQANMKSWEWLKWTLSVHVYLCYVLSTSEWQSNINQNTTDSLSEVLISEQA